MTQLNIVDKAAVAVAIQELYINTLKVNSIASSEPLSMDRFENQLETVKAELKELNAGMLANDPVEIVDGCIDLLVTISFLIMLQDGNDSLTKDAPKYLNTSGSSVEQLVDEINIAMGEGSYIDMLGLVEDMASQLNADMSASIASVGASNLSKFITLKDLEDTEFDEAYLCADLEAKGRYKDVYSERVEFEGETWVVLKSKYDITNDEHYPKGKFLKIGLTFQEPTIIVYE